MITLFTAPKPFDGHIDLIQRNALASWLALGADVEIILLGDEPGMDEAAAGFGVRHLPKVERNESGTPLLHSIFAQAEGAGAGPVFCYANADILLLPDLLTSVQRVMQLMDRFLIVGRRWDLDVSQPLTGTAEEVRQQLAAWHSMATLHRPAGSDYFVYRGISFADMPPFALGRAGWDNWMIYSARAADVPVIDSSKDITVLHQNHDYGHLPGGEPHYRLPESEHNVNLAGGREMIFTLLDATWTLRDGELQPKQWNDPSARRRLETSLFVRLGPGWAARAARLLLHPLETAAYFSRRLFGGPDARRRLSDEREATSKTPPARGSEQGRMVESTAPNRSKSDEV